MSSPPSSGLMKPKPRWPCQRRATPVCFSPEAPPPPPPRPPERLRERERERLRRRSREPERERERERDSPMMAVRSCDCCCFVSRGCGGCAAVEYRHSDLGFRDLQSFRAHPDIKDRSVPTRQQTSVNREPAFRRFSYRAG